MVNKMSDSLKRVPDADTKDSRARIQLGKEAIRCALNGEWEQAVAVNRQILHIRPTNCEASNRLAKALMELGHYAEARQTLEQLRLHSPSNAIARKNLARLDLLESRPGEGRSQSAVPGKSPGMFIAESGKSCTTTLCRQAVASETTSVSAGDVVALDAGNDGISVNTLDGQYLGTLQRRLGRRVNKLMAGGNRYEAAVVGIEADGLSVILREIGQAPALRHVVSFPAQVSEPHRSYTVAEPDEFMPPVNEDPEQVPADTADPDEAIDGTETAAMDMPDDTSVESVGIDEIPTLDTDEDSPSWSPVTPPSDDEEDWD